MGLEVAALKAEVVVAAGEELPPELAEEYARADE
ncbi:hypothetical protein M2272_005158 [Mycobacterium frederiksbergense]|uniref:Uncharacterized protein n=1 Tax=Mycolicibacterium frederiksbergense TaxID=117567 RepID=A0ABT6L6F3_9MYCO|nr:hypothetical protein [Mycolicibacterium frederiksbergense]